jgi:hypothetical protein
VRPALPLLSSVPLVNIITTLKAKTLSRIPFFIKSWVVLVCVTKLMALEVKKTLVA